ncbi:hypothetical protein BLNAU_9159 [Blattamonas nauphoetae]|uniref:Uncharacterized protein n=1 Tax=Blattamonas nauphoetae TaxID=2049346 RepID=A0ABQ9XWE9_9EUKA|nr:hypothetical protein BLNAU_9159 [Blattamonas nauphoetae]
MDSFARGLSELYRKVVEDISVFVQNEYPSSSTDEPTLASILANEWKFRLAASQVLAPRRNDRGRPENYFPQTQKMFPPYDYHQFSMNMASTTPESKPDYPPSASHNFEQPTPALDSLSHSLLNPSPVSSHKHPQVEPRTPSQFPPLPPLPSIKNTCPKEPQTLTLPVDADVIETIDDFSDIPSEDDSDDTIDDFILSMFVDESFGKKNRTIHLRNGIVRSDGKEYYFSEASAAFPKS